MDKSFPYKDKLNDIVISLYELFKKDQHNVIPDEIINYVKENDLKVSEKNEKKKGPSGSFLIILKKLYL